MPKIIKPLLSLVDYVAKLIVVLFLLTGWSYIGMILMLNGYIKLGAIFFGIQYFICLMFYFFMGSRK